MLRNDQTPQTRRHGCLCEAQMVRYTTAVSSTFRGVKPVRVGLTRHRCLVMPAFKLKWSGILAQALNYPNDHAQETPVSSFRSSRPVLVGYPPHPPPTGEFCSRQKGAIHDACSVDPTKCSMVLVLCSSQGQRSFCGEAAITLCPA